MEVRLSRSALLRGVAGGVAAGVLVTRMPTTEIEARDRCELVELYPGYPGYQGWVTGVYGVGDHECLDDLEARYSRFDRRNEDRENRRAARRLGIAGSERDWTWENWLAIEGERGISHPCYSCNILNPATRKGTSRGADVKQNDPRLTSGTLGDTFLMGLARKEFAGQAWGDPVDDYQFRALVSLVYADPFLNAPQLIRSYERYGREWLAEYSKPGGEYILPSWLWERMIDWGGYFPVPDSASMEDQQFAMRVGYGGVVAGGMLPQDTAMAFMGMIENAMLEWRAEVAQGGRRSLRRYLIAVGAKDWLAQAVVLSEVMAGTCVRVDGAICGTIMYDAGGIMLSV